MVRKVLFVSGIASLMSVISGCSVTRPPQINLTIQLNQANPVSITDFNKELARDLDMIIKSSQARVPDAEPSERSEIYDQDVSIFVVGVPDNKCVADGRAEITFRERFYRFDIVNKKNASEERLREIEGRITSLGRRYNAVINAKPRGC